MSAPSSPSSEWSELALPEYTPDPNVVKLLVQILTAQHGILQYHAQTRELSTYPWLIQIRTPHRFCTHYKTHLTGQSTDAEIKSTLPNLRHIVKPVSFVTRVASVRRVTHTSKYPCFSEHMGYLKGTILLNARLVIVATCMSLLHNHA
jgi:hypothetical protein